MNPATDPTLLTREEFSRLMRLNPVFRHAVLNKYRIALGEEPLSFIVDTSVLDDETYEHEMQAKLAEQFKSVHGHEHNCACLGYDPGKVTPEQLGDRALTVLGDQMDSQRRRVPRMIFHPADLEKLEREEEEREEEEREEEEREEEEREEIEQEIRELDRAGDSGVGSSRSLSVVVSCRLSSLSSD